MGSTEVNEVWPDMEFKVVIGWPKPPRYPSTDPNDVYRSWLESNIGRQHYDWDWKILSVVDGEIEVCFAVAEHAMIFKLVHGER